VTAKRKPIVVLRRMTAQEFVVWEDDDAHRYGAAMVEAGFWPPGDSYQRGKDVHAKLLPQGVETLDHHLLVIESPAEPSPIGVLWLAIDRTSPPPSGFIYDLFVGEPFRGRGYGERSMLAVEEKALELGLSQISLRVFASNEPAKALYAKLGYQVKSMNPAKRLLR
jgi:RimJ/RimL family protein N-acetyltransferase